MFIFILVFNHKIEERNTFDERKLKPPLHKPHPPPEDLWPPLLSYPLEPTTTNAPPVVTGPSGLCPFPDPEFAVHLPHKDPKKFYKCANGVAYVKECPTPLKFNATAEVCDW